MQIHPITPNESIISTCSLMLDELYAASDYATRDAGNSLIDDDRSQFLGYLGEIIDDGLYTLYGVKTSLYEIGEETEYFSEFKSARILKDYIQFSGYINTSDTDCNVEVGKTRVHSFTSLVYEIETVHIQENQWQISFKIPLDQLSELMYNME